MFTLRIITLITVTIGCAAFSFLGNIKLPTLHSLENLQKGQRFGNKKVVVITGTSSGMGRKACKQLVHSGGYYVIGAVRDLDKMAVVAEEDQLPEDSFHAMHVELGSFASVRNFVKELIDFKGSRALDRLVCNAAVYQPTLSEAKWSEDGIEQQIQINFLSHFLLCSLLITDMQKALDPRVLFVGSVTGNDNTVGGGGVYPVADLRDLEGIANGLKNPIAMIDGYNFNGAKAYKDSKLCLMMIAREMHDRYHKQTGIAFNSIYPGCIADSPLFREKRPWFRKYFPVFMKYITGGYVGEEEAGKRLFQTVVDPRCYKSGIYWSWNGGPRMGRGIDALKNDGNIIGAGGAGGDWDSIYENDVSDKVRDEEKAELLWKYATEVTQAEWIPARQPKSPCPTLLVISAVTSILDSKERLERRVRPKTMGQLLAGGMR